MPGSHGESNHGSARGADLEGGGKARGFGSDARKEEEVVALVDLIEREIAPIDGILNPDHIAENYWMLHRQPRGAWTHELDMRPWREKW